jgi:hypothetical protein
MPDVKTAPKPIADPPAIRFVRACQGLLRSTTYQGSICLAFAGAVTLVTMMARIPASQIPVVFLVAMGVPLPFVKYFNTPTRVAAREIKKLKAMARQNLITFVGLQAMRKDRHALARVPDPRLAFPEERKRTTPGSSDREGNASQGRPEEPAPSAVISRSF